MPFFPNHNHLGHVGRYGMALLDLRSNYHVVRDVDYELIFRLRITITLHIGYYSDKERILIQIFYR